MLQPREVGFVLAESGVGDNVSQETRRIKNIIGENLSKVPITFLQGNLNLANPVITTAWLAYHVRVGDKN